jgi:hypothetical protein
MGVRTRAATAIVAQCLLQQCDGWRVTGDQHATGGGMELAGQWSREAWDGGAMTASLSARLASAVLAVARSAEDDLPARDAAFREAVGALVEHLKSSGAPPERVVIVVKRLVAAAVRTVWPRLELRDRRRIVDDGVRWCVVAYYGTGPVTSAMAKPS